ncbi:MAG: YfhO family protein [Beijerinckiaceae bacterium]|nr:YfhO family protein [Beijerinckiaceae bacterium]
MPHFASTGTQAVRPAAAYPRAHGSAERLWTGQASKLAILSLVAFYGLALACWLAAGMVVPWDSKNHFYAMFRFLGGALSNGEVPLWNPYHFGGHPAIADPQSFLFTPSMLLFALLAPNASMQMFDAVVLAHLLAGGICILGLLRRWGWHPAGAVLTAVIFMLGGAASSRLQHTGIILSYSFFPAALWCLDVMLERCSWRHAPAFAVIACLMALGRDQVAFLLCGVLAGYVAYSAAHSGNALAYLRARAGVLMLSAAFITAMMAVPVLLTMQFLADSNRPGFPFGAAAVGSLAPVNLITLFAPNFFGSLDQAYDYWGPDYDTMPRADWTDRAVDYLFIGTLPFLLILWHGFGAGRLLARGARFFVFLLALAAAYALGRYTPFFEFVFDWLPGVSLYRRPADATFLVNIALALSAGYLLHRYIEESLPRPFRTLPKWLAFSLSGTSLAALALLTAAALDFSWRQDHLGSSLAALAISVATAALGAAILYGVKARQKRVLAAGAFVLFSAGELLWRNAASPLNAEPSGRYDLYAGMTSPEAAGIELLRKEIAAKIRGGERPRVEMLGLKGPWQNASIVLKIENTLGYNPLRIVDYDRAVGTGQDAEDFSLRRYPDTFRGYNSYLASLLGLEYLVLDRPLTELPRDTPRPVAQAIYVCRTMYIYKLGRTAPRTYFASSLKQIDKEEILGEQAIPNFDTAREVLIDEASMGDLRGGPYVLSSGAERIQTAALAGAQGIGNKATPPVGTSYSQVSIASQVQPSIAIVNYTVNSVDIEVDAPQPGIVVLHDLFYPGWDVYVDGVKKPVLRANVLFRGVEVPRGRHKVRFAFRPLSAANLAAAAATIMHRGEE